MLANRTSRWSIGATLLCVVLLAASWFLLISPRRADATDVRAQAAAADQQAAQLQEQITELKAQFADLPKRQAELEAIKKQLPPKAEIPTLVRDLQSIAGRTGVSLDSIAPGVPSLVGTAGSGTAATPASLEGAVVSVPVAISVTGEYFEASLFVKNLQTKIGRAFLLSEISVAPGPEEVQAIVTAVPTPTGTATPAVVAPTAVPAPANPLARVTLALTGSVFVMLDGTTTLEDVAKDVKAGTGTATPATTPTAAGTSPATAN